MKLIDGKGQLGEELKKRKCRKQVLIYHTWNFVDKGEATQWHEYMKFRKFVRLNRKKKIIFISTKCLEDTPYTRYKTKAEAYSLE